MQKINKICRGIARYCTMTKADIMDKCDTYIVDDAGGYMGQIFRGGNVLAVAHIDFVGSGQVRKVTDTKVVSSALDDRLGVFAAIEMLPRLGINADVLLTDNEETGFSTIERLGMGVLDKYNWIVELDRAGRDVVTYGYWEMDSIVKEYWPLGSGVYSDIVELEATSPISAFNIGVGYYNQHSERCHVKLGHFLGQMEKLKHFYADHGNTKFTRIHDPVETYEAATRKYKGYIDYEDEQLKLIADDDDTFDWRLDDPERLWREEREGMLISDYDRWREGERF